MLLPGQSAGGTAAGQAAPSVPGWVQPSQSGGILLTNQMANKGLAMPEQGPYPSEAFHLPIGERIGGGPSGGGQREFATVRAGQGAFTPGAAPLTGKTWDEVKSEPNPILRAEWLNRNMEGAPIEALESDLGLKASQAEMNRRQGGLFEAQTGRLNMTPEERAVEQTSLPLQSYVEKLITTNPRVAKYVDFLQGLQIRKILTEMGLLQPGHPVPSTLPEGLEEAARQQAISQFIRDNQTQMQLAEARYGMGS